MNGRVGALRFGIQPQGAQSGMTPGHCPNKALERDHLGCGGRPSDIPALIRQWFHR